MQLTNVADPGSPEVLSPQDFESSMVDRRADHSPVVKDPVSRKSRVYDPMARPWSEVTAIVLHQTACNMGERVERYDHLGAHFASLRSGRVLRMCDEDRIVYHANRWNARAVGIEVDGLYAGDEDDPDTALDEALRTTWDDPSTPTRERPMIVTPQSMRATRELCRWIYWNVQRHGGMIKVIAPHRQSSKDRRNDPGEAIWKQVALPLIAELKLTDGGRNFQLGGYPIPEKWDSTKTGIPY